VTSGGLHVVRAREGEWQNVCDGVAAKQLFVDTARDSVTMLIRMQPGSTYPSHRHAGPEQCLVLEGDVEVNGLRFDAGDYQCMLTGSVHNVTSTINGCLLLIVSSQHDQLLA
jgi:anti-sigma factor ChrR (cupin superfamily)